MTRKVLGRGLEALISTSTATEAAEGRAAIPAVNGVTEVSVDAIGPNPFQPRTRFDDGALKELADSIRATGVLQPVLLRRHGATDYELVAGERRLRAAQLAGLKKIPAIVKEYDDRQMMELALIENIQREDLNPLEEAQGLQRLVSEFKLTHEQAAAAVGRSRSAASNLLRLLNLAAPVQQMLMAGDLDMGHARALLPLDNAQQILSANEIVARKLSVRDAEKLVARVQTGNGRQSPLLRVKQDKPRDLVRLEERLADLLAAAVEIRVHRKTQRGEQGEIAIAFGSLDELNGLLDKLGIAER